MEKYDEEITGEDFSGQVLGVRKFDACIFKQCSFREADLSGVIFSDCTFEMCDFSLCKVVGTQWYRGHFLDCRLLGLAWDTCDGILFRVEMHDCSLDYGSMKGRRLDKSIFSKCNFLQVDFAEVDLRGGRFDHCDFEGAEFFQTQMKAVDFSTCTGLRFDPRENHLGGTLFGRDNVDGILDALGVKLV